jgi:cytochrome c oxidase assembly protein subunit 15
MLIGFVSMVLLAACWLLHAPRNVKWAAVVVFLGVCVQGLIGGMRVRMDRQTIAFAHSVFGCCVFVALWVTALMTSRGWEIEPSSPTKSRSIQILAVVYPAICLLQYTMGGFIRHLGTLLHEHVYGAVFVFVTGVWVVLASYRSGNPTLKRRSRFVGVVMLLQVLIGVLVWRTKYGFPSLNMIAVQHSMMQVIARTVHTVMGMAVVTTAVLWAIQAIRVTRKMNRDSTIESDHQTAIASV